MQNFQIKSSIKTWKNLSQIVEKRNLKYRRDLRKIFKLSSGVKAALTNFPE